MTELIRLIRELMGQGNILDKIRNLQKLLAEIERLLVLFGFDGSTTEIRISFATAEDQEAFINNHFGTLERPILDLIKYIIANPDQIQKLIDLIMSLMDLFKGGASVSSEDLQAVLNRFAA